MPGACVQGGAWPIYIAQVSWLCALFDYKILFVPCGLVAADILHLSCSAEGEVVVIYVGGCDITCAYMDLLLARLGSFVVLETPCATTPRFGASSIHYQLTDDDVSMVNVSTLSEIPSTATYVQLSVDDGVVWTPDDTRENVSEVNMMGDIARDSNVELTPVMMEGMIRWFPNMTVLALRRFNIHKDVIPLLQKVKNLELHDIPITDGHTYIITDLSKLPAMIKCDIDRSDISTDCLRRLYAEWKNRKGKLVMSTQQINTVADANNFPDPAFRPVDGADYMSDDDTSSTVSSVMSD